MRPRFSISMRRQKLNPEEKQAIKDLKALAKRWPKTLLLMTTHWGQLHVMKKWSDEIIKKFNTEEDYAKKNVCDFDEGCEVATIKIEAREDIGYW